MRVLTLITILLLMGCASHLRYEGTEVARAVNRTEAYVVNPDLERELRILEFAGIYQLVDDQNTPVHLRLLPMEVSASCGNAVLGTTITLGLVPAKFPDTYYFQFEEIRDGKSTFHTYELGMVENFSLYERFRLFADDDEELGDALRAAAYEEESAPGD